MLKYFYLGLYRELSDMQKSVVYYYFYLNIIKMVCTARLSTTNLCYVVKSYLLF